MIPFTILPYTAVHPAIAGLERRVFSSNMIAHEQHTDTTRRLTYEFGLSFHAMLKGDFTETPIPQFLTDLRGVALRNLHEAVGLELPAPHKFTNCIVSDYIEGDCLEPHIDVDGQRTSGGKPVPFAFGENVVGIVLIADKRGGLYFMQSENGKPLYRRTEATRIREVGGMTYLLTGALRHAPTYHGVSPVARRRLSVTFRTVEPR